MMKEFVKGILILLLLGGGILAVKRLQENKVVITDFYMETARIEYVYDGDTIKVAILGDEEQSATVRMAGMDAPESVHPAEARNTVYGELASDYTREQLERGQIVYLTKDVSDVDRYGRLIRFVWTSVPDYPWEEQELRNSCYNAKMIQAGYATAESYEPDSSAADLFFQLQEEAKEAGAGLWREDGWN